MADDFEVPGKSYLSLELDAIGFIRTVIPSKHYDDFIKGKLPIKKILEVYFLEAYRYYIEYTEDWEIPLNHDAETDINNRTIYFRYSDMKRKIIHGRIVMSIYHEISHVILGHAHYATINAGKIARKNKNIPTFCSAEWQAEALASALSMPFPIVLSLIVYANRHALSDKSIVSELSRRFHVSEAAAVKRIANVREFIIEKGRATWLLEKWRELERSMAC